MKSLTAKDIGALARDARTELGMSQAQLGLKIGASRFWVAAFERGKSGVELGLVLKALRALRLNLTVESKDELPARDKERSRSTAHIDLSSIVGSSVSPLIFRSGQATPLVHSSLYQSVAAKAPDALFPAYKRKQRKLDK